MDKQTAGRRSLGDFAPEFAHLNDDVLFGEVWSREDLLPLKERSLITVTALISKGLFDNSLKFHLLNARKNGVSKTEMVAALTQLAFYVGWPNVWAAFPLVKEVYADPVEPAPNPLFGLGEINAAYAQYFTGRSYLKPLCLQGVKVFNVTFEPGCRNAWHIHHGGGQILLVGEGEGWYQEWGKKPQKLHPGDCVYIAPELKHWHGASSTSWFTHLALEIPAENGSTEWCERVDDDAYAALK